MADEGSLKHRFFYAIGSLARGEDFHRAHLKNSCVVINKDLMESIVDLHDDKKAQEEQLMECNRMIPHLFRTKQLAAMQKQMKNSELIKKRITMLDNKIQALAGQMQATMEISKHSRADAALKKSLDKVGVSSRLVSKEVRKVLAEAHDQNLRNEIALEEDSQEAMMQLNTAMGTTDQSSENADKMFEAWCRANGMESEIAPLDEVEPEPEQLGGWGIGSSSGNGSRNRSHHHHHRSSERLDRFDDSRSAATARSSTSSRLKTKSSDSQRNHRVAPPRDLSEIDFPDVPTQVPRLLQQQQRIPLKINESDARRLVQTRQHGSNNIVKQPLPNPLSQPQIGIGGGRSMVHLNGGSVGGGKSASVISGSGVSMAQRLREEANKRLIEAQLATQAAEEAARFEFELQQQQQHQHHPIQEQSVHSGWPDDDEEEEVEPPPPQMQSPYQIPNTLHLPVIPIREDDVSPPPPPPPHPPVSSQMMINLSVPMHAHSTSKSVVSTMSSASFGDKMRAIREQQQSLGEGRGTSVVSSSVIEGHMYSAPKSQIGAEFEDDDNETTTSTQIETEQQSRIQMFNSFASRPRNQTASVRGNDDDEPQEQQQQDGESLL